jgi:hypothetical protein
MWRPCIAWGVTPSLPPNTTTQQNVPIRNCDFGRFVYTYGTCLSLCAACAIGGEPVTINQRRDHT